MIWVKRHSLLLQMLLLTKGSISIPAEAERRRYWPLPCSFWELLNLGIQVGSDATTQKWRQYLQSAYILQESSGKCHKLILTELPYQSHSVGRNQLEEMDSPQINLEQLMLQCPQLLQLWFLVNMNENSVCQLLRELASHITVAMSPCNITTLVSLSVQQA